MAGATLTTRVEKVEAEIIDLKQIAQETNAGVHQLRHVFGLNGNLSPDAVSTTWEELVQMVAVQRKEDLRHAAYQAVRDDLGRRLAPFGGKLKLTLAIVGGASAVGWMIVAWSQAAGIISHSVHLPHP